MKKTKRGGEGVQACDPARVLYEDINPELRLYAHKGHFAFPSAVVEPIAPFC